MVHRRRGFLNGMEFGKHCCAYALKNISLSWTCFLYYFWDQRE